MRKIAKQLKCSTAAVRLRIQEKERELGIGD